MFGRIIAAIKYNNCRNAIYELRYPYGAFYNDEKSTFQHTKVVYLSALSFLNVIENTKNTKEKINALKTLKRELNSVDKISQRIENIVLLKGSPDSLIKYCEDVACNIQQYAKLLASNNFSEIEDILIRAETVRELLTEKDYIEKELSKLDIPLSNNVP